MYKILLQISLIVVVLLSQSCKKDETDPPVVVPTAIINAPPKTEYFLSTQYTDNGMSYAVWTTDFENYTILTDQFSKVYNVNVSNDMVLLAETKNNGNTTISYAALDDLTKFQSIKSSKYVSDFEIIDGIIVVFNSDGNNNYLGYCNTNIGQTSVTFEILPSDHFVYGLFKVKNDLLATSYNTIGALMGITNDGQNWNFTNAPMSSVTRYEFFDNRTWAFSSSTWAYTNDEILSTATWISDYADPIESNTTDTVGSFWLNQIIESLPSEWRMYGTIYANQSTGNHYPCVNSSTDQGQTWKTYFLTGIPLISNNVGLNSTVYSSSAITLIDRQSGSPQDPSIFTSLNGIDFTPMTDQMRLDKFYRLSAIRYKK